MRWPLDNLTHWGWVMHIYVSKLIIIGLDNGLLPGQSQAIIWTNVGLLLIGPLWINFSEILFKILIYSFKKMHLKMSSAKWRPCCLSLNVLKAVWHCIVCCTLPFAKWQEYWGGPGAMLGILLASSIRWTGHKFRYDIFYWISCIVYLVAFYTLIRIDHKTWSPHFAC